MEGGCTIIGVGAWKASILISGSGVARGIQGEHILYKRTNSCELPFGARRNFLNYHPEAIIHTELYVDASLAAAMWMRFLWATPSHLSDSLST
jgi:hypothetical protein